MAEKHISDNKLTIFVVLFSAISILSTSTLMSQIAGPISITGFGVEQQAGEANVTLAQEISINLVVSSVDFNDLALGASNATTNLAVGTGPAPLQLQNIGTIECNVSMAVLTGDDLWSTSASPSYNFQFNATTNGSTTAQWYGGTNETDKLANVPLSAAYPSAQPSANLVYNLTETAGNDIVLVGLNITAPVGEAAGPKGATLLFQAALG